jgi:DNA-binding response OmpR family regulator
MSKPVILIVDDEQIMITMLGKLLHKEFQVLVATGGEQALIRANEEPPDLILLDIRMPEMDGYQVCRRLKENERTRDIPVIFLTSNSDEKEEAYGFEVGAVDYINKPVRPAVVLARARTHLQLKLMTEELRHKNQELERAAQLRDDVERITRHDLKTPLNSVISVPALLMPHYDFSSEHQTLLRNVERAGHKMLEMINRSMDLYKMEVGTYQAMLQPFDLAPVLKAAIGEAAAGHAARGKSWRLLHNGEPAAKDVQFWITGEEMLCYPMLTNLLQNAFEASPEGAEVEVELDNRNEAHTLISITNHGEVPEAIRPRFFEKYVTSGKQQGTGLGTYSARLCAETQNGAMRLESLDDGRTRIVIEMPPYRRVTVEELQALFGDNQAT